jgi:hypothetical protein
LFTHFETDMVVLEKWVPKTYFGYLLWWRKERYYLKRF